MFVEKKKQLNDNFDSINNLTFYFFILLLLFYGLYFSLYLIPRDFKKFISHAHVTIFWCSELLQTLYNYNKFTYKSLK